MNMINHFWRDHWNKYSLLLFLNWHVGLSMHCYWRQVDLYIQWGSIHMDNWVESNNIFQDLLIAILSKNKNLLILSHLLRWYLLYLTQKYLIFSVELIIVLLLVYQETQLLLHWLDKINILNNVEHINIQVSMVIILINKLIV